MIVLGAKGFAKQLLPTLLEMNLSELFFFDDQDFSLVTFYHYPIIRSKEEVHQYFQQNNKFVLGVGSPVGRKKLCEQFESIGGEVVSLINKQTIVSTLATKMDKGVGVLQGAIIESFVSIGKGSLINIGAKVCHDSIVGNFCEIGPNVTITGSCKIGDETSIGASATIIPGITVGRNVKIGAGAVVTGNLPDNCVAVGVPAKIIKQL